MNTVEVNCKQCDEPFAARVADRKRGWARFCSKRCKARHQEKHTGQFKQLLNRSEASEHGIADAHLFSNEDHDCNKD